MSVWTSPRWSRMVPSRAKATSKVALPLRARLHLPSGLSRQVFEVSFLNFYRASCAEVAAKGIEESLRIEDFAVPRPVGPAARRRYRYLDLSDGRDPICADKEYRRLRNGTLAAP